MMSEHDYENCLTCASLLNDKSDRPVIYLGTCLYPSYHYVLDYECRIKYTFNVELKDQTTKNAKL